MQKLSISNTQFCHLHLHNEFSYLDGYGTAEKYLRRAKQMGFSHIGLTNHGNIDGLIQWQQECDKVGIKPVLGTEMYVVPDMKVKQKGDQKGHILFLVKNQNGWKTLCKIMTVANLKGFYYKPRIDFDFLLSCDLSGLIITTACSHSFLGLPKGEAFLWSLSEKLKKDSLYIEIMPHVGKDFDKHNERLVEFKEKYGLRFVATNDVHYLKEKDWKTHEVLLSIQTKTLWKDEQRWKFDVIDLYLKSANEMISAFKKQGIFEDGDYLSAMENTMRIAEDCKRFRIEKKKIVLPAVCPPEIDEFHELWKWTMKGLFDKKLNNERYKKRLNYELKVIKEKGFVRYFLIVGQLIQWCKDNEIMTGAGRGSVGGSLVAYLMDITTVDPIKYKLLFSRFINRNRIDFPDIDMDFEDRKREQVRQHLIDVYGKKSVFGISTFLSMKSKAVVRDISRVFGVPLKDVNEFTKTMTFDENENSLLAHHAEGDGKWFTKKYPKVIYHAKKLEGQLRGVGQHAAGVVVTPKNIDFEKGSFRGNLCIRNNAVVVNWEMKDIDYVGLVKFDILGLNTLSVLSEIQKQIRKNIQNNNFRYSDLIPSDKSVFDSLSKGSTIGVFQFCTGLMTETCKKLKIDSFSDMVAAVALVRPGAMYAGVLDEYVRRKQEGRWRKKHPTYEHITKDTYGLLVYQEQVMQVINKVAGLPYSVADEIRKVIGKKRDVSEFEPYRKKFLEGCKKEKIFSRQEAKEFWSNLLHSSHYLFNKSHSVEYAMLAYWTAWAKVYYPSEFIVACLAYGGESNKQSFINEATRLNLKIIAPKVGVSDPYKWKIQGCKIYIPFIEVKGIGEKTARQYAKLQKNKAIGFFETEVDKMKKTKGEKILNEIGAYDLKSNKIDPKYFKFTVQNNVDIVLLKKSFQGYDKNLKECTSCSLVKECYCPVPPSQGKVNVAIVGDAPGWTEDSEGKGFVGKTGKLLFNTLNKFGYKREYFHTTNVCKCFPKNSKSPSLDQIKICTEKWLKEELTKIQCSLILCVGGSAMFALSGRDGGITKMNGKVEYNSKYNCYVCYVIHPAAVLRNQEQMSLFKKGIRSFADILKKGKGK